MTAPDPVEELLGGLVSGGAHVSIDLDLGAVVVTLVCGDESVEMVLSPHSAIQLTVQLAGAAMRLAWEDDQ